MKVPITHPDKVLFPKGKITKEEMAKYYAKIAPRILPLLKDRPISMKRYPSGIRKTGFFQKNAPESLPKWVKTTTVKHKGGGKAKMILCNDKSTLQWLANQNCITPHIWLSKVDMPDKPDRLVFDLDPPKKGAFATVVKGALFLRHFLEKELKLKTFVTTTGGKGVHIVIPLKREKTFDEVRAFAKEVTKEMAKRYPKYFTTNLRKEKRGGKIFLDILRNGYGQTVAAPYAVRPKEGAPIATPLSWNELQRGAGSADIRHLSKVLSKKNPWASFTKSACSLKAAERRLQKIKEVK